MPSFKFYGTREDLMNRLRSFAGVMSGRVSDSTGVAEEFLNVGALIILGKIQEAFVTKSEGGRDEMGIQWPPLSPVTLALRNKTATGKVLARMTALTSKLPRHRQKQVSAQYFRLMSVYRAGAEGSMSGLAARNHARRLLELMKPAMSPTGYTKLKRELKEQKADRAHKLATAGAMALILRVSGELLRTFSPEYQHPMRLLVVRPGSIVIGCRVSWFKYHQSKKPRKLKKDGTPKLPRRQILPDAEHPIPKRWKREVHRAWKKTLGRTNLLARFLQPVSR